MKPIRITRLAPGEWFWRCTYCHKQDTIGTQPAAMALGHAHYILTHWPSPPEEDTVTDAILDRINTPAR